MNVTDPGMGRRGGADSGLHPEAREQFARIIERIDNIREDMKEHRADDDRRFDDHEKRLRSAEGTIGKATGYASVVALFISLAGEWLKSKIGS